MKMQEKGFTIIEVVVTLAVVTLFLSFFFQMYLAMESQRISVARQALASDIAYSNLRKFTVRPNIPCDAATMDISGGTAGKTGGNLGDENGSTYSFVAEPVDALAGLGGNVHQTMRAFAPKGCGAEFATTPLKIEATVTYGTSGGKVVHASYLN